MASLIGSVGSTSSKATSLSMPPEESSPRGSPGCRGTIRRVTPRTLRTKNSSPTRTPQMITGFRSVPSARVPAIRSSPAAPIRMRSFSVHVVIREASFLVGMATVVVG